MSYCTSAYQRKTGLIDGSCYIFHSMHALLYLHSFPLDLSQSSFKMLTDLQDRYVGIVEKMEIKQSIMFKMRSP